MIFLQHQEEELVEVQEIIEGDESRTLIVFNDNVNTFEHVITTLIKVCKHNPVQAEQCTWIIHNNGKCAVKNGSFNELKPMQEAICEAGIDAKIF